MLFTKDRLIKKAQNELFDDLTWINESRQFSAAKTQVLEKAEKSRRLSGTKIYDIFLSHSTDDSREVLGLVLELEDLGYSVYVDWIEDPELDRSNVTKKNVQIIKNRMSDSKSLFFAFSTNAQESVWMPWELGYFDGIKQKAAILPISETSQSSYNGTEYLKLYYYITKETTKNINKYYLWVNETNSKYVLYDDWINKNQEPYER